jgi:thioredoxin 1
MEEDKELEEIKRRRLNEMLRRLSGKGDITKEPVQNKPVDVTDATFTKYIQNHTLTVIDCWAPWCFPCRMISPILEEMAMDYAGKISFGKLNVDENRQVAMQYQTMSIPTILVFKNGKLVDRIVGAMPRRVLEPRITRHLDSQQRFK